jgi:hypothetical protein
LNGCTVSGNAALYGGGGIDSVPSSFSVILSRSIVGDQDDGSDCFGLNRIVSLGYNLDSDGTCELTQPTDLWFTDPVLGSLADNGGPTWTHALLPRSPAIDAGSCPGTLTDQRGFPRPVNVLGVPNVDDGCDIGAYEYEYGVHWPTADAGQDEAAECTSHEGALVLLDGSGSSDPDSTPGTNDDIVLFEWFENFEEPTEAFLGYGEILEWMLPIGSHVITLRVTDSTGEVGIDEVVKTVVDTTPPGISVIMVPNSLWPPNHRMVDVQALVHAPDICGVTTLTLTSVASDEPDDAPGGGDGRTTNDIQDAAVGTADFDFRLRAERNGGGGGRTYTATYVARDDSGNEASASGEAYVLRDQDGVTDPIQVLIDRDENGFALSWTAVISAMHYNVIRARLIDIREMESVIDLGSVLCVEAQSPSEAIIVSETPLSPAPGEGFFYLVEYDDGSRSSYGTESASKPRAPVSGDCF